MKKALLLLMLFIGLVGGYYTVDSRMIDKYKAINTVKSSIYASDSSITLDNAVKSYRFFENIEYRAMESDRGRMLVRMFAKCNMGQIKEYVLSDDKEKQQEVFMYTLNKNSVKFAFDIDDYRKNKVYFVKDWVNDIDLNKNIYLETVYVLNHNCTDVVSHSSRFVIDGKDVNNEFTLDLKNVYENSFSPSFYMMMVNDINIINIANYMNKLNGYYATTKIGNNEGIIVSIKDGTMKYHNFKLDHERINDENSIISRYSWKKHNYTCEDQKEYSKIKINLPEYGELELEKVVVLYSALSPDESSASGSLPNVFVSIGDNIYKWFDFLLFAATSGQIIRGSFAD